MDQPAHEYAVGMYDRVGSYWEIYKEAVFNGACGFSVLSGPPIERPPLMIIGENPGFGAQDIVPHVESSWPPVSHIGQADWALDRKLRAIFDPAGLGDVLRAAIQTNFNFFKSSSIDRPSRYRWYDLPSKVRQELELLSRAEIEGFIRASLPSLILVLGIDTFDRNVGDAKTILHDRASRRRLMVEGQIVGTPAVGILHPTGAQVATDDWMRVGGELKMRFAR